MGVPARLLAMLAVAAATSVAAAADRFVVIADSSKRVETLSAPVPVELLAFGLAATLRRLQPITLRNVPPSPDGGVIADYRGAIENPAALAAWLDSTPGLIEHGLFPPQLVAEALVARGETVDRLVFA